MSEQQNHTAKTIPQKLFALLERQVQLSREMLDILAAERQALTEMDVQALIGLSRRKEHQVTRMQQFDQSLLEIGRHLAPNTADQADGKIIQLSSLAPRLAEEEAARLEGYREKLVELREEILSRNLFNKLFAEDTRKYLNDAINMITTAISGQEGYGQKGHRLAPSRPALISREI